MTENQEQTRRTMQEVSHTHPHTGDATGRLFRRGPTLAADGGQEDGEESATDRETIADLSHTTARSPDETNRSFERGRQVSSRDE
jgi:hypothetical protein